MATTQEINTCLQSVQQKSIKIDILDSNNNTVGQLEGLAIDGSIIIDTTSAVRRSCDIQFVLDSSTMISETSLLWINKRFKLWAGIYNFISATTVWYNLGTYIINNPNVDVQINSRTVSINGYDKMCFLDGTISGALPNKTIINSGVNVSTAVQEIITTLGKETVYLIDAHPYTVPYKIEKDIGTSVYEVLKELADLYMTWKVYFDINGIFRFSQIKDGAGDPVVFNFGDYNIINSISENIKYEDVKNYYKIVGRQNTDGTQYSAERTITNALYPTSPFTVEKMGETYTRKLVVYDEKYYKQEQVDNRRDYEIYKHNTLASELNITCLPLLFLDVDQIITVSLSDYGISGNYLIDRINFGLRFNSLMTITGHKLY